MSATKNLLLSLSLWACAPPLPEPLPEGPTTPPTDAELLASRPYTVTVPASYSDAQTWPLLLVLHGYGGDGVATSRYLGFASLAATENFFLVAPQGLFDSRGNRAWHSGPSHAPSWDVEYLLAIAHDVSSKYRIDAARIFVAGHSQGAHMAHRMACDASGEIASIASLAGQVTKVESECAPAGRVSVLQVHGDADNVIGYYGDVQNDPPLPSIPSAHETVAVWARNNHCTGAIASTGTTFNLDEAVAGSETSVEAYSDCPAGIDVQLWTMQDVGHDPAVSSTFATRLYGFLSAHPHVTTP